MREKYVKLGVEEQRRLNKVKEKRVKEVDEKFDVLKREVNARMEEVSDLIIAIKTLNVGYQQFILIVFRLSGDSYFKLHFDSLLSKRVLYAYKLTIWIIYAISFTEIPIRTDYFAYMLIYWTPIKSIGQLGEVQKRISCQFLWLA